MFAILNSFITITSIFSFSTLTAYLICKVSGIEFINPQYNKLLIEERLKEMGKSVIGVIIPSSYIMYTLNDKLINSSLHTGFETISNISMSIFITEGTYYIYHRLVHRFGAYISIHRHHHSVKNIYPFDTFNVSYLDELVLMILLASPNLFLKLTFFESYAFIWLYITGAYLIHSKEIVNTHYFHHIYYNCNYCILFPIYDIIFGTYKQSNNIVAPES